jgi:hypothetical protein
MDFQLWYKRCGTLYLRPDMADDNLKAAMDLIRGKAELIADGFRSDPRITEIGKLLHSLNTLEELSGEPLTTMGTVLKFGMDESGSSSPAGASTRPDEYYGLEPLEAAKRVLKKIGRSAGISEIMAGIKAGGGETGSQSSLQLSLARSTMEIAKISDGVFGLLEFYPHIKRGKPGRRKKGEPDAPNGTVASASPDAVAEDTEDEGKDQ